MRKELCRNFQGGSCQYGARCKFRHTTQQQSKANNPFGFGGQNASHQQQQPKANNPFGFGGQNASHQQQQPNPFGFGVQNNSQPTGSNPFGNKQNQIKPFENKWSRFSSVPSGGGAPTTRPTSNQSQPADHKCTDPDSCKRITEEDFKNERPLWKLTCYGHWKYSPCDIIGDVSCEELRALAYDDAKQGLSLQSVVERERNLLNSKLIELENFLCNPYKGSANSLLPKQSAIPGAPPNMFSQTGQNIVPPMVPGFSQPGTFLNTGFGARPSAPPNISFGHPSPFPNYNQPSNAFGMNNSPSIGAGLPAVQFHAPTSGSPFTSNTAVSGKSGINSSERNQFSTSVSSISNPDTSKNQTSMSFNVPNATPNIGGEVMANVQLGINSQREAASGDVSIWLMEKWNPGEIPEQAPPDAFV